MTLTISEERRVLGTILISGEIGDTKLEDFRILTHRMIFVAAYSVDAWGSPVDPVTVAEELDRFGQLEAIGGMNTLADLIHDAPVSEAADNKRKPLVVDDIAMVATTALISLLAIVGVAIVIWRLFG